MNFYDELENIIDFYESDLLRYEEKAKDERESLGLDNPENVMLLVHPLTSKNYKGMATRKDSANILILNLLNLINKDLDLASNKKRKELINKLSVFEKENGKAYLKNPTFFEENEELLKEYFSWHPSKLNKESFFVFRHEYEHLVQRESYLDNVKVDGVFDKLNHKALKEPIFESRAHMFTFIEPHKWKQTNYGKVGLNIFDSIMNNYYLKFEEDSFKELVNELNVDENIKESVILKRYDFEDKNLLRLVEDKHTFLCANYIKNTKLAVLSTISAFREDPSRLNKANDAKTIEEYHTICYDK